MNGSFFCAISDKLARAGFHLHLHFRSPCHVVYTDFRPTPLQHYVYPSNGDGLYLVVDEKSTFREDNFQRAVAALTEAAQEAAAKKQVVIKI